MTVDQARKRVREFLGEVARGGDPAEEFSTYRKAPDIRTLCDRFMEEYARVRGKPTTVREYRRAVDLFIKPAFGSRKICDIARADVAALHHDNRHRPYQANRTLGVLSTMLNLGELWGLRPDGSNPTRHVSKYRERRGERFLSPDELARLFATLTELQRLGSQSPSACEAFRLLALTGCRLSEIQFLRWDEEHPPYLLLRDSKTDPRKIPLGRGALDVLRQIHRQVGNPYVIAGAIPGQPLTDLQRPWRRIRALADLDDVRIYDLRHIYASNAVMAGLSLEVVAKLLGHRQVQTTARYAHLSDDHVSASAATVSERLQAQLAAPPRHVQQFASPPAADVVQFS